MERKESRGKKVKRKGDFYPNGQRKEKDINWVIKERLEKKSLSRKEENLKSKK